jgi:choline dehydrogenase-like flavoprotein
MSFTLKGQLADGDSQHLSNYIIKAFDKEPIFDILGDEPLGSAVTFDDGTFRIDFTKESFKKPLEFWANNNQPKIYLKVFDTGGVNIYETPVIDPNFVAFNNSNQLNQCEAVVVGSGFGGTIITSSLVNKYVADDQNLPDKRRVVLLERGQWWVSHELPSSPGANEFEKEMNPDKGMREYLESNDIPYRTWAYPDNINGLGEFMNTTRIIDRRGLYDYRMFKNVHTIAGSGVGGGSLVYANVIEEPDQSVIDSWDSQLNLGINYGNISPYFDMASGFIGVNKIATTAPMGNSKLLKTDAFQEAAEKIRKETPGIITNKPTFDPGNPDQTGLVEDIYAANLAITDIPYRKDERALLPLTLTPPNQQKSWTFPDILHSIQTDLQMQTKVAKLLKKYSAEQNACERQGRCVLGCIPGARHTFSKKIYDIIKNTDKKKQFEMRVLCEVYDIEPLSGAGSANNYRVYYTDYSAREWTQASFSWNHESKPFRLDIKLFRTIDEGRKKIIECKTLILAAGSIGSTEILIKSVNTTRTTGQKLSISNRLGIGYSTNGDLLGVISTTKKDIQATRGPIITSAIKFNEAANFIYTIEDSNIPKMFSGISHLLSQAPMFRKLLGLVGAGLTNEIMKMITPVQIPPFSNTSLPLQFSDQDLSKTLLLSGMGTDTYDGTISPQDTWKVNSNRDMNALNVLNIDFDLNKLLPLFTKMRNSMERLASEIGENGSSFSTPLWDPNNVNTSLTIVLHNLGGCSMGKDRNHGVVDSFGRVYKGDGATITDYYSDAEGIANFYVVDGGIVPTSLGINSSLTISALAFRIAEEIVGSANLPVEAVVNGTETIYFPK